MRRASGVLEGKAMRTVKECKEILELAIGEVDHTVHADILESTICYLNEFEKLKAEKSWSNYPEQMGR